MNSPNVYQKVEVLETGTPDPKKITKVEVAIIEDLGTSKARKKKWIMQKQTKTAQPLPHDEHSGRKVIWFCKMVFWYQKLTKWDLGQTM